MDRIIKKLLIDKGMAITDLARKTGYSRTHLSAVIHGRIDSPKARRAIAAALEVEFEAFWNACTSPETSQSDGAAS
ncbi:MAG: helix-turn-helix transcriptional regulator [Syntrophobacteraceae bacterium]|jgi:lambda repressor-like predicted transcriptional regulator